MRAEHLVDELHRKADLGRDVVTVDEDGFVRDVVGVSYDPEADVIMLRLEIKKKNGEIE